MTLQAGHVVLPDGTQQWWVNNALHREDGPATISPDGAESWWHQGQLHRVGGPAYQDPANGEEHWALSGRRHRLDGPAITWDDGVLEWWVDNDRVDDTPEATAALVALDPFTTTGVLTLYSKGDNVLDLIDTVHSALATKEGRP